MFKILLILYIISVVISFGFAIPMITEEDERNECIVFVTLFSIFGFMFMPIYLICILNRSEKFHGFRFRSKRKASQHKIFGEARPIIHGNLKKENVYRKRNYEQIATHKGHTIIIDLNKD